jgi:hypothetical protein
LQKQLIKVCLADPEARVALTAWQKVRLALRQDERIAATASVHADIRAQAILSGPLPRSVLLDLYLNDAVRAVRDAARLQLPGLTVEERNALTHSQYADVRSQVLASDLPLKRLRELCWNDIDPSIRSRAFTLVDHTKAEVDFLGRCEHTDVRLRAIESGQLGRKRLAVLCTNDPEQVVRLAAWQQMHKGLRPEETQALIDFYGLEVRASALLSVSMARECLLDLCGNDWQSSVRKAAWERLSTGLTEIEAETLGRSIHSAVRNWALRSGMSSRTRLVDFCLNEPESSIRQGAWENIRGDLTISEAHALSSSTYWDVRLSAVNSNVLSQGRLVELCIDPSAAVRQAAYYRLLRHVPEGRI